MSEFVVNNDLSILHREVEHELYVGDNIFYLQKMVNEKQFSTIDLIYIDPPYGNVQKRRKIEVNYKNTYKRPYLIESIKERIKLAYLLLKDDGLFWCSCDDRNIHHFRILFDSIFGEENFICCFPRKTRTAFDYAKIGLNQNHDYILLYAKNYTKIVLQGEIKEIDSYSNPDNDPKGAWKKTNLCNVLTRENRVFPIENPYTGKVDYPPHGRMWTFTKKTFPEHVKSGKIVFYKEHKPTSYGFFMKIYLSELRKTTSSIQSLYFDDNKYINANGTKEVNKLGLGGEFMFVKPTSMIESILEISSPKNDITILDLYSGSGTTCHAVIEMNKKDKGNRKCISVSINEVTKLNKSYIYSLTIPRLIQLCNTDTRQGVKIYEKV